MPTDIANITYGSQEDYKRLYYSNPEAALKLPVTLQAGYGVLESGTILAENLSAAGGDGKFMPYNLTSFDGTENSPGRAYLVANTGTTDTYVYVTMDDSYKFAVGDDLIVNDNTTSAENLGAITAIDRTTYPHMAKITATAAIGGTAFTTARFAYVCVEAGDSTNNYSDAVGVLEKTVDTGTGSTAAGAVATIVIKNAIFYSGMLPNSDAAARTDMSASTFGQYTYL